jgi:7-carboxy-7-deazaguanine synthase
MNKKVLIETGGALSIKNISKKTHIILDIKCPSSNMSDKNLWDNFNYIKKSDEIKFVIGNKKDYAWTKNIISKYQLNKKCFILISPVHDIFCPSIIFFIPNYKFDFIAFLNIIKIVP